MSGVGNVSIAIWNSVIINCINLLFAFVGVWLVDVVGRRKLTIIGLFGEYDDLVFSIKFKNENQNKTRTRKKTNAFSILCGRSWCINDIRKAHENIVITASD